MTPPVPPSLRNSFLCLTRKAFSSVNANRKAATPPLIAALLIYALSLQLVPRVAIAARTTTAKTTPSEKPIANRAAINGSFSRAVNEAPEGVDPSPASITDAVVSRHKPTLNSGRIEGSLRVLLGESFTISGATQITADVYLPGTPAIQLGGGAQYAGTLSDGGTIAPANYTVSLSGGVDLPGHIHTNVDPVQLSADFPDAIPAATGTRTVSVHNQSDLNGIGSWQTVRDLSATGNGLTINLPPGNSIAKFSRKVPTFILLTKALIQLAEDPFSRVAFLLLKSGPV